MVDMDADHEYGYGFDRSACEGCPKNTGGAIPRCGICGCPLATLAKVQGGSPPSECIRLQRHKGHMNNSNSVLDKLLGE